MYVTIDQLVFHSINVEIFFDLLQCIFRFFFFGFFLGYIGVPFRDIIFIVVVVFVASENQSG